MTGKHSGLIAMLTRIKSIFKRPFLRSVATVATGAAVTQAITLACMPLITRWYGPEAVGLQGVFNSLVSLGAAVAALAYPIAMVLPKSDEDAVTLARLSVWLAAVFCASLFIVLWFFGGRLLEVFDAKSLTGYESLIPLAIFFMTLSTIVNQWLIRKQAYRLGASRTVANSLLLNATRLGFGWFHPSALALILTNTFGFLSAALLACLRLPRKSPVETSALAPEQAPAEASQWEMAKRHRDFPLLRMPQNLVVVFSQSIPVLILATLFGQSITGQYSIAYTALVSPSFLIGNAVNAVLYPRFAQATQHGGNIQVLLMKATLGLLVIGVVPAVALLICGPSLFQLVFGAEWRAAGHYAQLLVPWLLLQFAYMPTLAAQPVLKLQGALLGFEFFSSCARVLAMWYGFRFYNSASWAIGLCSAVGTIFYIAIITLAIRHAAKSRVKPMNAASNGGGTK